MKASMPVKELVGCLWVRWWGFVIHIYAAVGLASVNAHDDAIFHDHPRKRLVGHAVMVEGVKPWRELTTAKSTRWLGRVIHIKEPADQISVYAHAHPFFNDHTQHDWSGMRIGRGKHHGHIARKIVAA